MQAKEGEDGEENEGRTAVLGPIPEKEILNPFSLSRGREPPNRRDSSDDRNPCDKTNTKRAAEGKPRVRKAVGRPEKCPATPSGHDSHKSKEAASGEHQHGVARISGTRKMGQEVGFRRI